MTESQDFCDDADTAIGTMDAAGQASLPLLSAEMQ